MKKTRIQSNLVSLTKQYLLNQDGLVEKKKTKQ